jgi:hypothetical protein
MGIQDLGAIGEFISSLVIVVTLLVLIYEVRGAKNATLQANAQERQRKQEGFLTTMSETPSLVNAWAKANQHLGDTHWSEEAVKFGIAPDEWRQLSMHFTRMMGAWREAFDSDLPEVEQTINDFLTVYLLSDATFGKYYDEIAAPNWGRNQSFIRHVDEIRANMQATIEKAQAT